MSCFLHRMDDVLEEAGLTVAREDRAALRAHISHLVGDETGKCPSTWRLVKEWKADERRRKQLVRGLRKFRAGAKPAPSRKPDAAPRKQSVQPRVAALPAAPDDEGTKGRLAEVLEWATRIDPQATKAAVEALRARRPKASPRQLAEAVVRRTRLKTLAVGVGTGLPANPWISVGSGVLDAGLVLRIHASMIAQLGEILAPGFADDPDGQTEMLVLLFGAESVSQAVRGSAVLGGMGLTRQAVKRVLKGTRLRAFRNWALKYFGKTVGQKVVVTKVLPVVGAAVGGGWNFAETGLIGKRAIGYFENEAIVAEPQP